MGAVSDAVRLVDVRNKALSVDEALAAVRSPDAGGVVLFVGMVRNHSDGDAVSGLDYEAYEPMAISEMRAICEALVTEHPGVRVAVVHRVGTLSVGELAIVCAVSAAHRDEAFSVCRALIDRIKESVPIWKREHRGDSVNWVGW